MVRIIIDNSYSKLLNLSPKLEKEIREKFSYREDPTIAFFRGAYEPKKISMLSKRGDFPTGLVPDLFTFLHDNDILFDFISKRARPEIHSALVMNPAAPKPYEAQVKAANKALEAMQCCISMPTGTGKSMVIAMIAARLGVKTLVIVPTLEIKAQLTESLNTLLVDTNTIRVENIANPKLATLTDFDCLIIDEAHHAASSTYKRLNKTAWSKIYYRYFFTATPFRSDESENILFRSIAGQVAYELTYKEALKHKYIVPVEAYTLEVPAMVGDTYNWKETYSHFVVNNAPANRAISEVLKTLDSEGASTLCLVKEVAHGKTLSELTGLTFTSGQDDEVKQKISDFNSGKIKVLIGTEGILGEGIDTKPCEYVVIAGMGKAKGAFLQKVGRCVRNYAGKTSGKVILVKNKQRILLRHYAAQVKILKEYYGVKPKVLE